VTNKRPRRTQSERSTESAERLLNAAIELIAERGFDRTTVAEIGARAGYSRSMVRARYGSKEALLESIFANALNTRLLPQGDEGLTGLPWVLARLDHVTGLLLDEPGLMRAFCVMTFEAVVGIDSMRTWYTGWFEHYERLVAEHLHAGRGDGSVRDDLDPEHEAQQFVLTGIGLVFRWTLDPDGYDLASELTRWRTRIGVTYAPTGQAVLEPPRAA
jgi:AcrR family transcriptional regulator